MNNWKRVLSTVLCIMLALSIMTPVYATALTMDQPEYWIRVLVDLLITVFIICVPIALYRIIIGHPVTPKTAKIICIIYGIISYFVFYFLAGTATIAPIILWSYVSYRVLISGKDRKEKETEKIEERIMPKVEYCKSCGAQLDDIEVFCRKCGARIARPNDANKLDQ